MIPDRIDLLLDLYQKNGYKNISGCAIQAGYSEYYAKTAQRKLKKQMEDRLLERAVEAKAKADLEKRDPEHTLLVTDVSSIQEKEKYFDVADILMEYKKIIKQDKDYSTKLKAISPILQKYEIIPKTDENIQVVPTLNIVVKETNTVKELVPVKVMSVEDIKSVDELEMPNE
jgi:hypothetical protein